MRTTRWQICHSGQRISQNLEDTEWLAPAHSSRDSDSEPPPKMVSGSSKHCVCTHFPKNRKYDVCLRSKITKASCRRRTGAAPPRSEKFGVLITADHEVLSEKLRISKQSSIRSRCAGLGHPMDPVVSVQNKNFSGNTKELAKVLGAR